MNNKVYSATFRNNLAVGASDGWSFNIPFPNREAKIKSISWDLAVWQTAVASFVPLEVVDVLTYQLSIGNIADMAGQSFDITTTPAGGVVINGYQINFYRPRQYLFDSFFIRNILSLTLIVGNRDLMNMWTYSCMVIVETEEK